MPAGTVTFALSITPMPGSCYQVVGRVDGMSTEPIVRGILARSATDATDAARGLLEAWAEMFTPPDDAPQKQPTH